MKYLKTYEEENYQEDPKIGDYVFCQEKLKIQDEDLGKFLDNNVGKFVRYRKNTDKCDPRYIYIINYEIVPQKLLSYFSHAPEFGYCRAMSDEEIKYWDKDKETVEAMMSGNKYNL